jgi:hypothetical protein
MRHLLLFAVIALLPVAVFAQTSPGCIAGSVPGMHNCRDGSYTHVDLVSNQTNTGPNEVRFSGPITPGDVVGFDYSFIHDGAPQVRRFRHAMKAGDTHRTVLDDLAAQWRADPVVNAAIGADIVSYALVRQAGPESWVFQFYENWPFVDKANPRLAIALSPGATARGEGSAGNKTLESNPYWSCGRTTIEQGRSPQKGDRLCSFYGHGRRHRAAARQSQCRPDLCTVGVHGHRSDPRCGHGPIHPERRHGRPRRQAPVDRR